MNDDANEAPVASAPAGDGPRSLASLRHDLRTPINQILGYAELLAEEAEDREQPAFVPDLGRIADAARELLRLVDEGLADAPRASEGPDAPSSSPALEERLDHPLLDVGLSLDDDSGLETAPPSVLVVDDNEMNRDVLSRRLERRGYRTTAAEDGPTALGLLDEHSFDLVLLDVMMPGMSGLEVLERIRETWSAVELPVIMATARDRSEDIVEALRLQANDYVTKPLDFPVVLARSETQVALKRATERTRRLVQQLVARNRFITRVFGRYMSDDLVERILQSPETAEVGGKKCKVTIMFTDLRGFTSLSERLPPEAVVTVINNYLEVMSDVIEGYNATQVDFRGDSIVAVFGALVTQADDAAAAVACAVQMQRSMGKVNELNQRDGLPPIHMGIGLNTGDAVIGNVGSSKHVKYTVIGRHANIAARAESCTVGGQVLISDATLRECEGLVEVSNTVEIAPKGMDEPLTLHEVAAIGGRFDLRVPSASETLVALDDPVEVELWRVDGKQAGLTAAPGRIVAVSRVGARLTLGLDVAPLDDLKLRIVGDGPGGDAYAKVMRAERGGARSWQIRFTSLPPEIEAYLSGYLPGSG